jgi:hypothetical protein
MIFSSKCNRTDRALNRIGIKLDAAVVHELSEGMPAGQRIADCICELGWQGPISQSIAVTISHMPPAKAIIGDRGYDSDGLRQWLKQRGIQSCIRA